MTPPNPEAIARLLERVRGAKGADRLIDAMIWSGVENDFWDWPSDAAWRKDIEAADEFNLMVGHHYTSSLDAAIALVERMRPDCVVAFLQTFEPAWVASIYREGHGEYERQKAPTPALALLAALLSSMQEVR